MITELYIDNLRCFRDFTLRDITPVVLVSGRNNAGKSTLLEGVFLLFDHADPGVFFKLNAWRDNQMIGMTPQLLWEHLFSGMDMTGELKVEVGKDGKRLTLSLQKDGGTAVAALESMANSPLPLPAAVENLYPLKFSYTHGDYEESGRYVIAPTQSVGVECTPVRSVRPALEHMYYISQSVREPANVISERFGRLMLADRKDRLIEALRFMDDGITDLFSIMSGGVNRVYAKTAGGVKMPLCVMGDGINKLLTTLMCMLDAPGCVLLIDEAENGFHYSFHKKFWNLVFNMTKETGCQVFATTHSYECISGAVEAAVDGKNSGILSCVRLGPDKNRKITPHVFSGESLAFAVEAELEVR
ncbi:MAG: AAA family ATPase [Synergistaceae bacterium]|jgi:hypothetical protein|nr:AAA family ATPase [Synergistaceae bacterium]